MLYVIPHSRKIDIFYSCRDFIILPGYINFTADQVVSLSIPLYADFEMITSVGELKFLLSHFMYCSGFDFGVDQKNHIGCPSGVVADGYRH